MSNIVQAKPVQLRAAETFIENYKPLTAQDIRNLDRKPYDDFQADFRKDPVKIMVEASDLGMQTFGQYGNLIAPDTMVEQNRSITTRLMQDEGLYANDTELSAASTVQEFLDAPHRTALLFNLLTGKWQENGLRDRNSVNLPTSSPLKTPPGNLTTDSAPPPVAIGTNLQPGELIANTHSVNTNTYSPFKWDYDEDDMKRTKVRPAETIPASTLGESSGNVPMAKWGNRFVLPYEMLTGGQGLRVNKLSAMVALDAAAEGSRQYEELVTTLINGDSVTAAVTVETGDDYSASNNFAFTTFLNWLDEAMDVPFQISHVLMPKEGMRQLRSAVSSLTGNLAFDQLNEVGLAPNRMTNLDQIGNVRYGRIPDNIVANTGDMVGVDARYAVEKVNRAGMTIRQQAEQIANQTREVVVSDTYLLARIAAEAVKIIRFS